MCSSVITNGLNYTVLKELDNNHDANKDCLETPAWKQDRERASGWFLSPDVRTCGSREVLGKES